MRAPASILCAIALLASGCGGGGEDEKERYVERFRPLNDRLIAISQQISDNLAGSQKGETLGVKLDIQIAQLDTVNRNIENLDTPEELRDESRALTGGIRAAVVTLKRISTAVREGRDAAAASATVELASRAQAVNRAQERMARATGAQAP